MTELTELEKEFLESYKKYFHNHDIDYFAWRDMWLQRSADLDKLVTSKNPKVRLHVVDIHRDEDLKLLVNDESSAVRQAVAIKCDPKIPVQLDLLHKLMDDNDRDVVQTVAMVLFKYIQSNQNRLGILDVFDIDDDQDFYDLLDNWKNHSED